MSGEAVTLFIYYRQFIKHYFKNQRPSTMEHCANTVSGFMALGSNSSGYFAVFVWKDVSCVCLSVV